MPSIRHNPSVGTPSVDHSSVDDTYLDAAREAILAVGWSRTTLTDIARRAGVSRMTLYRRWPDTQTLLADLMTREWSRAVGPAAETGSDAGPEADPGTGPGAVIERDPLDRISTGVVAAVQAVRSNELLRRIIDVDPQLLLPYLLDRRGRSQDVLATSLAALVHEGQRAGTVRAGDPEHLARAVLLACHGFALSAHTMVEGPAPSRDADVSHLDAELATLVTRFLAR